MQNLIENEFDFHCTQQHRLPICAILQDQNLNVKDRLLCQKCIFDLENAQNILGWRKVQEMIQSHMKKKQQINQQVISPLLPLVKEVKTNIEFLKDFIMKEFRILEEILEEWQVELSKEIKLLESQQFINELEYVFGNKKVSLDEIVKRDLKKLNSNNISKVQSKLKFFKEFEQQSICSNILNSIEEEQFLLQIKIKIDEKSNELDNQENSFLDSNKNSQCSIKEQYINSDSTQQSQIFQQEQSPQSKQISQDNLYNKQQLNQQRNMEQIQLKEGLSLPLIKLGIFKDGDPQYKYYGQQKNNCIQYKNIIFIGQREDGKTTLLNAFVNYYFGIAWGDKFRIIVADQEQTTEISHYYIEPFNQRSYGVHLIDTPGNYGKDDQQAINKVSKFLQDNQNTIDIIILCIKATNIKLTVEAQQMLQSIVQIIGKELANKIIVARTFYSGGDVDQSMLMSQQSPFYNLSSSLCSDYHLEFNSLSINKITNNKSAKVYYDISIENFKKIESKMLLKNCNQQYQPPNNFVSNFNESSSTQLYQDQQIKKGYFDRQYQQVYQDSYIQLRILFMQCLRIYKKQNACNLQKIEKSNQYYSLNCNRCLITCFCGFKDEKVAEDFFSNNLNGECYCGHSKSNIVLSNIQWVYVENNSRIRPEEFKQSTFITFSYLYKLFQLKENNEYKNENQFIEILKKEEEQDQKILENFQAEFTSAKQTNQIKITK